MAASAHPSMKVDMVLIENELAVLLVFCGMTSLYVDIFISVGDLVYRRKGGSTLDFALLMWLL